jgi:hypothetical protein
MRRSATGWISVTLCSLALNTANAQSVPLMKGAPFQATKTLSVNRPGEQYTASSVIARSSDGSTHEEIPDIQTRTPGLILIVDIPGMRRIFLDVKRKVYSIQQLSESSIPNAPTPDQLQKNIDGLKKVTATHESQDGYEITKTPLGFRTQDGFVAYGTRSVYERVPASSKLTDKIWEDWWMPALGLNVQKTSIGADNKPTHITKFTNIRAKEPDASLFEIPPDYVPSPPSPSR